ncbi:ABC transporter permease/M1 family aminopeptidase [Hymenobacter sp. B81]|uniref:ABC transporter permease/M1 family aminopeptidase n=1 Tax=Hymenobacter sp. B81 TaxID=3344878 RepID=UPI0037DBFF72
MFLEIFLFELRYRLKRPATYIYFGLMALMAFLFMLAVGGVFGANVSIGGGGGKVLANSPYQLNTILTVLSLFGVFITSSMMGTPVYRDFDHRTHSLYYTAPISKAGYLGGRFLGSFVITALVFLGGALGAWLATFWPTMLADKLGPNTLGAYLQPYLTHVLPNLFLTGAIFFTAATLSRSALSIYLGGVLFLVLYSIAGSLQQDLDNDTLSNLLDPLGGSAIDLTQRYWTTAEKNTLLLPWSSFVLQNRLLWLGVGALTLLACYGFFRFSFANKADSGPRPKASALGVAETPKLGKLVTVTPRFTAALAWAQLGRLVRLEFFSTVRSVYFIGIAGAGILFLLISGLQVGKLYGTNTFPVTPVVVQLLAGTFALFQLIIIIFYAGELVWRERDSKVNQIYDAMPMPSWVPFTAKLLALMLIQVVLLAVVMLCGLLLQTGMGYFTYELDVYVKELFGFRLIGMLLMCVLAMLVQVLCNNKYMGHFIMVLYYLFNIFKGQLGLEHNLYSFNGAPGTPYSAMNGYGHFALPFFAFKFYWAAFAVLLALASSLLWPRGTETRFSWRWQQARFGLSPALRVVAGLALLAFVGLGGYIYYNTNVLNQYRTSDEQEQLSADFEKKYKRFDGRPQPRIVAANVQADIFPAERDVRLRGYYWLLNRTPQPLDSVLLTGDATAEYKQLRLGRPAQQVLHDRVGDVDFRILRLQQPLQPGDSVQLHFDLAYTNPGFRNSGSNTSMVYNGTFVNNAELLPHIGYQEGVELSDDDLRKEYDLKPKPRMASVRDSAARQNTYLGNDADWIRFEATVSTSADQIAIAPGYLQKEWTKDGRRYFHYKMDAPILNFYSFLSARYAVYKDQWKNVPIEIYYQPGHEYNLKRMARGVKEGLDYYTAHFGPYQHRQVRILEFPGYSSFAQSFPNTIPFSESIGFIADVDSTDPKDIDYPLYITAHEVAHQWFAHQIIGGNVQGSTLMSETLSQYAALMVMRKLYGEAKMKKFLRFELDSYLSGRSMERKKEVPLYLVENQPYIHYRKGSLAMYALQDYIGEQNVNRAIREYRDRVAYQRAPFTNSLEFIAALRKHTPDSLQYVVTDLFEKITLYENKVDSASYRKLPNGQYRVSFTVDTKKLYADSLGNETPDLKARDLIDVSVTTRQKGKGGSYEEVPLVQQKRRLKPGRNRLEFVVPSKPERVGIDPQNKLVDRNPDDNTKTPEEKKA